MYLPILHSCNMGGTSIISYYTGWLADIQTYLKVQFQLSVVRLSYFTGHIFVLVSLPQEGLCDLNRNQCRLFGLRRIHEAEAWEYPWIKYTITAHLQVILHPALMRSISTVSSVIVISLCLMWNFYIIVKYFVFLVSNISFMLCAFLSSERCSARAIKLTCIGKLHCFNWDIQ